MADFRWIQVSLFVIAVLQFTAPAEGLPSFSFFTVRAGQDVTLSCENVIDDQQNCDSTTWLFSYLTQRATVQLIKHRQIGDKSKSDRLSVTQKCSLVIKKVTDEDVGRYTCQQWKSRQRQEPDSVVHLSLVTVTEYIRGQVVWCSVRSYDGRWCRHTVKWLYDGNNVNKDHKDLQTSQSRCSAYVTFKTSHFIHTSKSDLLKCEVTDENNMQQLFPFRLQPSGDDTITKPRPEPKTRRPTTKPSPTKPRPEPKTRRPTAKPSTTATSKIKGGPPWWIIAVSSVAAAFIIIIVVVVTIRRRAKGKKTQTDEDVADPEGGVCYASVTFTKRPGGEARLQGGDDEEDDEAGTYTTLNAPPSSAAAAAAAGASADANVLYATVNKPKKQHR